LALTLQRRPDAARRVGSLPPSSNAVAAIGRRTSSRWAEDAGVTLVCRLARRRPRRSRGL